VKYKTPFLTGFSTKLFGSAKRALQVSIRRKREKLLKKCLGSFARQFSELVPPELLESLSKTQRRRVFSNPDVFWAWLSQILEQNDCCSAAVSRVQAWCLEHELPVPSSETTAYCKARLRFSPEFIAAVHQHIIREMQRSVGSEDFYRGLEVKSVDGSSVQLMDTPGNQASYPQPGGQKEGCGFPVMKFVGVLNHAHGCWEKCLTSPLSEKDFVTMRRLISHFGPETLLLADRGFCSYEIITRLQANGCHSLMRLHQMREKGFTLRKGKRIGKNERLVTWIKPARKPKSTELSDDEWEQLPATMEMRMISFWYEDRDGATKKMVLATTLLDHDTYHWIELGELYATRWDIELRLRDVKTTLGMEALNVKTPAMARKSLAMALLGFNLVKATCRRSVANHPQKWKLISFKGALDAIKSVQSLFSAAAAKSKKHLARRMDEMLALISTKCLEVRPGRWEPRMKKKRPKPFPFLDRPRQEYKEMRESGELVPV
jgi:hypothetical protein